MAKLPSSIIEQIVDTAIPALLTNYDKDYTHNPKVVAAVENHPVIKAILLNGSTIASMKVDKSDIKDVSTRTVRVDFNHIKACSNFINVGWFEVVNEQIAGAIADHVKHDPQNQIDGIEAKRINLRTRLGMLQDSQFIKMFGLDLKQFVLSGLTPEQVVKVAEMFK